MTTDLILAIDQGTTNTKAIIVDALGMVVAEESVRVPLAFPRPGWVETDARALWATVLAAAGQVIQRVDPGSIAAIALTNQRESAVAWDRRGTEPLGPCVSWQCRRTTAFCVDLQGRGYDSAIRERTGLGIDPMFSASKLRWLLEHIEDADTLLARDDLRIGTVDSWLLWNLTGGEVYATDLTNASRTQLLDLDRLRWDDEMADIFGIPATALPSLRGSSAPFGVTRGAGPIPDGIPIAAVVGDSHGALFGHGALEVGAAKATYGTGSSVMAPTIHSIRDSALSTTIAWSIEDSVRGGRPSVVYALEGNIPVTGAAIEWLAGLVGRVGRENELEDLARSVPDAGCVWFVPALAGMGAPFWDPEARGQITGLSRSTTLGHVARAALDGIAYQVRDVVEALVAAGLSLTALHVDGGAMRSDLLAEIQAEVLGRPVVRNRAGDVSAVGAAYLAGLTIGLWTNDGIRDLPRDADQFDPQGGAADRERGYRAWQAAVGQARSRQGARVVVA